MLNSQSGWHQEAASKGASPHEHNRSSPCDGGGEVGGDTDRSNPLPFFPSHHGRGKEILLARSNFSGPPPEVEGLGKTKGDRTRGYVCERGFSSSRTGDHSRPARGTL